MRNYDRLLPRLPSQSYYMGERVTGPAKEEVLVLDDCLKMNLTLMDGIYGTAGDITLCPNPWCSNIAGDWGATIRENSPKY